MTKDLAILRDPPSPEVDPQTLALSALVWVLGDEDRRERLLALTGLTPDALRAGLGDVGLLGAVLDFLCTHEPDLIAACAALDVTPETLVSARERLAR
ncbi:MAG: DUF3572 domain-containing protein [Novosphingobium sp.]